MDKTQGHEVIGKLLLCSVNGSPSPLFNLPLSLSLRLGLGLGLRLVLIGVNCGREDNWG